MPHHEYDGSAKDAPPRPWGVDGTGSGHDSDPRDEEREVLLYRPDGSVAVKVPVPVAGFSLPDAPHRS